MINYLSLHFVFIDKQNIKMKTIIISIFMAMMAIAAQAQQKSFYDFTVKTIDGEDISLSTFKGKKVLVVRECDRIRQ